MLRFACTVLASCCLLQVARSQASLPLPAHDIPASLNPPLTNGRVDVHGWLWLPYDVEHASPSDAVSKLEGYFYHHTPEFWTHSAHDFEIMVEGTLSLDAAVVGLPLPPAVPLVGTEYVFTPPEFSLDELITGTLTSYEGRFTNGSFDTEQRYLLSNGRLELTERTTIHYLEENATGEYPFLPYLSYPRNRKAKGAAAANVTGPQHLYFLHLEHRMPDFDQIVHVTVDPKSCRWEASDSAADLVKVGATFVIPSVVNDVMHRLMPSRKLLAVELVTDATRHGKHTLCEAEVLEEIHCVVMPDSFEKCPPL